MHFIGDLYKWRLNLEAYSFQPTYVNIDLFLFVFFGGGGAHFIIELFYDFSQQLQTVLI